MFTKAELEDLADTVRDIKLEDILDEEELAVIKENSTRYNNLISGMVVPKHNKKVHIIQTHFLSYFQSKTIVLKQIDGALYMDTWLEAIGEVLRWQPMTIWIGFSFLMELTKKDEKSIVYW